MQSPQDMLGQIETRGDFRRATGCDNAQSSAARTLRERLIPMWAALADAYGSAFINQFGEEPNDAWAVGLSPFSDDQIHDAFVEVLSRDSDFAPNLATFIKALKRDADQDRIAAAQQRSARALPEPDIVPLAPGEAAPYINQMRAMLS